MSKAKTPSPKPHCAEPPFHRMVLGTLVASAFFVWWAANQPWSLKRQEPGTDVSAPDYVTTAIPFFVLAILVELLATRLAGMPTHTLADSISSLSAGMFQQMFDVLVWNSLLPSVTIYCYVHDHFRLVDTPLDDIPSYGLTWALAFLGVDFGYYWFHRLAHEIHILWVAHAAHHSSSHYNLTTALRQAAFNNGVRWVFYLPLSLLFSPTVFVVVTQVHNLYQFWVHTQAVRSIGWLENILMTPSHHRVHHARNPYAIHLNYGGILIIWDKMFNTFVPEDQQREPLEFGFKQPLDNFDVLFVQFESLVNIFQRLFRTGRLQALYRGPAWKSTASNRPVAGQISLDKTTADVPDRSLSRAMAAYTFLMFNFSVMGYLLAKGVVKNAAAPAWVSSWLLVQCMAMLVSCGLHLDARPLANYVDALCVAGVCVGGTALYHLHPLLLTVPLAAFLSIAAGLPVMRVVLGPAVSFVSERSSFKPWHYGVRVTPS